MVKGVGWWKTFGTIVVLGVAFFVVGVVISCSAVLVAQRVELGGHRAGLRPLLEIAARAPFAICYISTMYLGVRRRGGVGAGPAGGYGMRPLRRPTAPLRT